MVTARLSPPHTLVVLNRMLLALTHQSSLRTWAFSSPNLYNDTLFFLIIFNDAVITVKIGLKIMVNELGEGDLELFQNTTSTMTLSNMQETYQHLKAKTCFVSYSSPLCDHFTHTVEFRYDDIASCDTMCTVSDILR